MNDSQEAYIPMDDGGRIFLRRWKSESPRAVLHIVHGMAEHSLRYAHLARRLAEEGIELWAADQRGHGETSRDKENGNGKGGLLGHCADGDGFARVTADIDFLNRTIVKEYPGVPLFLMGHSWGSFIVQSYIEKFEGRVSEFGDPLPLAGCILSGTRGPDGFKISSGALFMSLLASILGERKGSRLAKKMADGPYIKAFKPNRTEFDWLSRDEKEVDAYVADPLCGFLCSVGFYRDMARALKRIHQAEEMGKIRKELPIYIFSGSADPVGDMGVSPAALVVAYRHLGIQDLENVFYPDARHETLNETNRDEVTGSLVSWLLRHCT
ncbi:MAG: lysophospholipase [Treponema sp.]|jgi:alpha-beta hydrolase superfamily lysophospholipase|nr:lysophospholipase [Treponema sp.]